MKYCLDASVLITAWSLRESSEFLEFWNKLATPASAEKIIIIKPIFDEIKEPPLREWLDKHYKGANIELADKKNALDLRKKYQVKETAKGIGFNNTILVAYACRKRYIVVTNEAKQPKYEGPQWNKKTPLVCEEQKVRCITASKMLEEI